MNEYSPFTQISASAGSGKTYTLTRHFLDLLQGADGAASPPGCTAGHARQGYALSEMLAATFTNKAAAEMLRRVVSSLKEKALAQQSSQARPHENGQDTKKAHSFHAGPWVTAILRHGNILNIRTIDSLLTTLVRLSALELGLAPDFTPSFSCNDYFTPSYDALMEDLAASSLPPVAPAAAAGFLTAAPDLLRDDLREACRSLLDFTEMRGFAPKEKLHDALKELVDYNLAGRAMPQAENARLRAMLHVRHARVTKAAEHLLGLLRTERLEAHKNLLEALRKIILASASDAPSESIYLCKEQLDDCLNKASRGTASSEAEGAFAELAAANRLFASHSPLLKNALHLAPLVSLTREILARMETFDLLPGPRIPLLASRVLSGEYGVSDALCRLGTRLTHLLLDEFQDTSREQWAAIMPLAVECLSRGGSLTYVGDVKQAIYSWRGGDAALFEEILEEPELLAIAPAPRRQTLPCNWRSAPAVVRHNNAFFSLLRDPGLAHDVLAAMLPKNTPEASVEEAARKIRAVFDNTVQAFPPMQENTAREEGLVRLYCVEGQDSEAVKNMVRERLRRLFLDDLCRRHTFSDIAVLVRNGKNEGPLVAGWLTEWGLPVVTENSLLLAEHPLVTRLAALLSFLDYPPDDASFWEFISGPECFGRVSGLKRASLVAWLAGIIREFPQRRPPLYTLFRRDFPRQWERWLAPFHGQAGFMSAYDTLREAMTRFRLVPDSRNPDTPAFPPSASFDGNGPFLQRFLELAYRAESLGHSSPASFLAFWKERKKEERLPLPETMNAIRVMTIHKAKGLEFPVVVLPFHHGVSLHKKELAITTIDGMDMLTRATPELADAYHAAHITEALERLNLLYVAWTRPIRELHACITRPRTSVKNSSMARGLEVLLERFQETAGDVCQWEFLTTGEERSISDAEEPLSPPEGDPQPAAEDPADGIPADEKPDPRESRLPMAWLPRLKIHRSSLESPEFTARRRGILIHLCLEFLVLPESGNTDPESLERSVDRAVRQGMRLFPLPLESPEAAAGAIRSCLSWFAAKPVAERLLRHGLREQTIIGAEGDLHRVDILVDEGDHLLVADYKTGQPDPANNIQIRRYMDLLEAARRRPVRGLLVYLDTRQMEEVAP